MKKLILSILSCVSIFTKVISSEAGPKFKKGTYARINEKYPESYLVNKIFVIDTSVLLTLSRVDYEDWRVTWVRAHLKSVPESSLMYFGKTEGLEYSMHESWLDQIDQSEGKKRYEEEYVKKINDGGCIIL